MILLELFLAFFQIGSMAFGGGYAVLPFLDEVIVQRHAWLTSNEIVDIITISQMTPGPIAINAATFVGTKISGLLGSLVATTANVMPQFIIMIVLSKLVFSKKKITFMDHIIKGLKPGMVALIFIATISMVHNSIFNGLDLRLDFSYLISNINITALVTFVLGFILKRKNVGIIKIIIISAILGICLPLGLEALELAI
ncbi:MAG: chromate transporter [Tissierellia bacterium]|nr:chromate transporter [Tissierellia bacterium]